MTLIVEDGTGVSGANSYAPVTAVDAYLTDRNRQEENGWDDLTTPEKEANIVKATDFIEQRWGLRFLGARQFNDISAARATLTFTALPLTNETVTIGSTVYTFGSGVVIGASISDTIDNLVIAVATHADVEPKAGVGDTMFVVAKVKGTAANAIVTTETLTNGSWSTATLVGGADVAAPQPLSFPRLRLFDREGFKVLGIPERLRQATAEYAVRAALSTLMPDPTIDATGRSVHRVKEKVGPIETDTTYEEGGAISQLLRPYPAADRLLSEYVTSSGRVVRG